jgi:pyruvate/2-oxoglutarate dehydrogenase complex dihydrolipoamide acyltransferase (E2) component
MPTKVIMPQLGESVVEGTITRWIKQEGDPIEEFEALLEINTDKVDSEIPSPASGIILKILAAEGQTVKAGKIIAWIGQAGEKIPEIEDAPESETTPEGVVAGKEVVEEMAAPERGRDRDLGFISPVVAKLAKEFKVDLKKVKGSGSGGRITKKDVTKYIEQRERAPTVPEPAAWETPGEGDLFRPTELMFASPTTQKEKKDKPKTKPGLYPLNTMRKMIAEHMVASVQTAPHVTTVMEANLIRVSHHRQAHQTQFEHEGVKLTYTAYFAAAVANALRAVPLVNSSWSDEGILIHPQINLGIAVSLGEDGLIVPVIRDADGLSLIGLARAVNNLAERARARKLQPDEVKGGTFTITNHGTGGSLFATPIINQPQCAILGVGIIQKRPVVVEGDAIAVRPMVYLSLTFDHRILDGALADGFLAKVVAELENWPD